MKKVLALLTILAFLLLCWFGWNWYKDTIICCGQSTNQEETKKEIVKVSKDPVVFSWDSQTPLTNKEWELKKQSLIASMKDGRMLRIVGPYYKDEVNTSAFDNLGLARADEVKKLLAADIDTNRIETASKIVDYYDGAKTAKTPLHSLRWVVRNDNIQEIDGKALIYFPSGSTEKIENENINNYLRDVAEAMKGNSKTVSLTGHTDNTGNPESNMKFGLGRAESIKQVLIGYGVEADRISTDSKGQNEPIATNETVEGKQKNRRVELQLN